MRDIKTPEACNSIDALRSMLFVRPIEGNMLDAQQLLTSCFDEHIKGTDGTIAIIQYNLMQCTYLNYMSQSPQLPKRLFIFSCFQLLCADPSFDKKHQSKAYSIIHRASHAVPKNKQVDTQSVEDLYHLLLRCQSCQHSCQLAL